MKCQNHTNCGDYCETTAEISAHMCGNCLESDKQREDDLKNLVELRLAMDLIRRAAGLSDGLTPHEIACKVAERLAHMDGESTTWKSYDFLCDVPRDGSYVDLWHSKIVRIENCHYDKDAARWKCGTNTIKAVHITHYMIVNPPKE